MFKFKILLLALLLPIFASAIQKEALIVAIGEYKNGSSDVDLPGIDKDVKKMTKLLEAKGFHVTILYNQNATLANVIYKLESYRNLKKEDVFVYYQSSHGAQVPDLNGDEIVDHRDEVYVMYDAMFHGKYLMNGDGLLIDDVLNDLLADIPAKKLLLADACHSGSSYKKLELFNQKLFSNPTVRIKKLKFKGNLSPKFSAKVLGKLTEPTNLIVLSAAKDNQQSISTSEGSLFTSALYDTLVAKPNISFKELERTVTSHIDNSCAYERSKGGDAASFEPVLSNTININIHQSVNSFLKVNRNIQRDTLVEEFLDELMTRSSNGRLSVNTQKYYNNADKAYFGINTFNKKGYLYILTIPDGENHIEVLYPNKFYTKSNGNWGGDFTFPSKNHSFHFSVTNSTNQAQKTVVYTILSEREIPILENSANLSSSKFQSIMKDFMGQASLKNAFKDILIQPKQNRLSVEKSIFTVGTKDRT